ncbi:hypothetical protein J6590_044023 [Homalodisca vitripennis]|nr:hypothetical protein J6590_044023 [Homalodisca vitripennis]
MIHDSTFDEFHHRKCRFSRSLLAVFPNLTLRAAEESILGAFTVVRKLMEQLHKLGWGFTLTRTWTGISPGKPEPAQASSQQYGQSRLQVYKIYKTGQVEVVMLKAKVATLGVTSPSHKPRDPHFLVFNDRDRGRRMALVSEGHVARNCPGPPPLSAKDVFSDTEISGVTKGESLEMIYTLCSRSSLGGSPSHYLLLLLSQLLHGENPSIILQLSYSVFLQTISRCTCLILCTSN